MEEASSSLSGEKRAIDGDKHCRTLQKGAHILHTPVNPSFKFVPERYTDVHGENLYMHIFKACES